MRRIVTAARDRKLDRIAVGYLVAAWVVVQAGSIALPAFNAPAWGMKLLIALSVIGLPLTLLAAWVWKLSRPDVVRTEDDGPLWARTDLLLIGLLLFIVVTGGLEFAYLFRGPTAAVTGSARNDASIAVLPFANLSGDPERRYFSDGIADQLISELSKTPALRVASRTSSFALAGRQMDVRSMAHTLNVRTVLEGSVREEGGRVRIAAQLINAADGFEMWSQTYDRDLTDILALQDEIARAITGALSQKLLGKTAIAALPHPKPQAIAPEAYRAYLQGKFFFAQRGLDSVRRAIALFEETTEKAPDFAGGYAALADAHATMAFNFGDETHVGPALYAVKQALARDPNNITALSAHSSTSMVMWKWMAAADDIRKMQRLNPKSAQVWHNSSIVFSYMGLPDLAVDAARKAVALDPLTFIDRANLAVFSIALGQYQQSVDYAREALELQPGSLEALGIMCETLAAAKKFDEAKKISARLQLLTDANADPGPREACGFWIAAYGDDVPAAKKIVDDIVAAGTSASVTAGDISTGYRVVGENAKALQWYIRALNGREFAMLQLPYLGKGPKDVFRTPEWIAARNRPDVIAWERARVKIAALFGAKSGGS